MLPPIAFTVPAESSNTMDGMNIAFLIAYYGDQKKYLRGLGLHSVHEYGQLHTCH
jgi:hypothetical protein